MEEPRKHIFEAAREACGRGLTQAEVELGDGWMDKLGLSRDGELFTAGELHTSAKGRALIQSREGCKLSGCSTQSCGDFVHQRGGNTEPFPNLRKGKSSRSKLEKERNVVIVEFRGGVELPLRHTSARRVLQSRILSARHPTKVAGSIVEPVAVDMVHRGTIEPARHKGVGDKPMDEKAMNFAAPLKNYPAVAVATNIGPEDASSPKLCGLSFPLARREIIQSSQPPLIRYLKSLNSGHRFPTFLHGQTLGEPQAQSKSCAR